MSCPMTLEKVEQYKVTEKQVKDFCAHGCSVDCERLFQIKFKKFIKKEKDR